MTDEAEPQALARGVYWVGVIDWNLRDFHGYVTPEGTTYNAYLIVDDKITLVDTVKAEFSADMLKQISQIVDPSKIDFVIVNHVEMDHSGSLPVIMKAAPDATIYCSGKGRDGLYLHYKADGCKDWAIEVVRTGSELCLGSKTLMFIEAAMLHWPDSMHTYIKEDKILLSNDAFGQHIATSKLFDDEVKDVMSEAAEYYANILMPFGRIILKYIDTVKELGIDINMIAPSHGIIWRQNPAKIIETYGRWARGETNKKVLIIYDTMWGSTHIMAKSILEGIKAAGVEVKLLNIRKNDLSSIITDILEASVIIVGSPTLNNGIFPSVSELLTYLKGLRPKGRQAVAFGSYGWGGGAVKAVEKELEMTGFKLIEPGLQIRYRPDEKGIAACRQLGERIAGFVQ